MRSWPGTLVPNQVKKLRVRARGWIEVVRLDTSTDLIWVRLDGVDPEPMKMNNFPVLVSRAFPVNNTNVEIRLICQSAVKISVEGAAYA